MNLKSKRTRNPLFYTNKIKFCEVKCSRQHLIYGNAKAEPKLLVQINKWLSDESPVGLGPGNLVWNQTGWVWEQHIQPFPFSFSRRGESDERHHNQAIKRRNYQDIKNAGESVSLSQ